MARQDRFEPGISCLFIPVITPRYFYEPVRRELQFFARRATDLGLRELILPLLYVDVPALHDEKTKDDLVTLVGSFQWEDRRDLRFSEIKSEGYRRGVAQLATRLVDANRHVESMLATSPVGEASTESNDDRPKGSIDRLATAEVALPKWQETLDAIRQNIELIGQIMTEATVDTKRGDTQGKGFVARQTIVRRVARTAS